jgi:hypothetical protein
LPDGYGDGIRSVAAINISNVPLPLRKAEKSEIKHPKKQEKAPHSGPSAPALEELIKLGISGKRAK